MHKYIRKNISLLLFIFLLVILLTSYSTFSAKEKSENKTAVTKINNGNKLYQKYCSSCHGEKRRGVTSPPLLNLRMKDAGIAKIIKEGLPATQMPAFNLTDKEISQIVSYIRTKETVKWSLKETKDSYQEIRKDAKKNLYNVTDLKNLTMMVEKGAGKVWVMQNDSLLDKFDFKNVHGGIKITDNNFYVPSRDGWVAKYNLETGGVIKIRPTINLRNICLLNNYVVVSSLLPQEIVFLDAKTLNPEKKVSVDGQISGVYQWKNNIGVFTLKNKAKIGFIKDTEVSYISIDEPIEDFFIDPLKKFIIGTSRKGNLLKVVEIKTGKIVFEKEISGFPHLSSSAFWYDKGQFYFATPHIKSDIVSIWRMYDWKQVKELKIGGSGFFVRSHPETPYLWADNGTDDIVLINKRDLTIKKIKPAKGKRFIHTEFSGDGKIAYVSIYVKEGFLVFYDAATLKELKRVNANVPLGKYNYISKNRSFDAYLLGHEVFMGKCWGCHHQKERAFASSILEIANKRTDAQIMGQILNPSKMAPLLGYKENVMPKIDISKDELAILIKYMRTLQILDKK